MLRFLLKGLAIAGLAGTLAACGERPPMQSDQSGYRGTGMAQITNPRLASYLINANQVPAAPYELPEDEGERASQVYQNVQVLGNISAARFNRLMLAITQWVVPAAYIESENSGGGCNYCHNPANLASDEIYTKVVARRMLQMTADINRTYATHVGTTGATCYTCHRGQPVPGAVWTPDRAETARPMIATQDGQNNPNASVGYSSLPNDPFSPYLLSAQAIRVQGNTTFPNAKSDASIRETEQTYGLMMHMSRGLGVNCTFCHNSRAFGSWEESNAQRTTAWHGIRMVQAINAQYIAPLAPVWANSRAQWFTQYGASRLGETGAPLFANCATCHRGLNKPLYGVSQMAEFPSLALSRTWPTLTELAGAAPAQAAGESAGQ